MTTSRRTTVALIVALVASLVVATVAVVDARRARDDADHLADRVAELEEEVGELEGEVAAADDGDDPSGDLFGDDELGALFDDLLSGISGDVPGLRCFAPDDSGLEGLLEGGLGELFDGAGGGDDADPGTLVTSIAEQVEQLRDLAFDREVDVEFLDDDALVEQLRTILDEDLDADLLADQRDVLAGLRAIPADADLEQLQRALLEDQVAGYYDPEDEQLVVRTPDGRVRPLDRITLAHELGHALVDQALGLPDLDDGADADTALGRLAVVEGDASLLMNRWTLDHLSLTDQLGLAGGGDLVGQQRQLAAFPHHLRRELVFPYTAGLDLVCDRWLEGGWDAVDALHDDPPTTSVGVLFPDRADEDPIPPPGLTAPAGAEERYADTFGAAPLLWLFEAPGGDTDAALDRPGDRAAAWAGGRVQLWQVDGHPVVGLALAERDTDDPSLCGSVTAWWGAAAPGATSTEHDGYVEFADEGGVTAVGCDDDGVRLAVAPDASTALEVIGADR